MQPKGDHEQSIIIARLNTVIAWLSLIMFLIIKADIIQKVSILRKKCRGKQNVASSLNPLEHERAHTGNSNYYFIGHSGQQSGRNIGESIGISGVRRASHVHGYPMDVCPVYWYKHERQNFKQA